MRYSEPNTYGLNVTLIHERCIHREGVEQEIIAGL